MRHYSTRNQIIFSIYLLQSQYTSLSKEAKVIAGKVGNSLYPQSNKVCEAWNQMSKLKFSPLEASPNNNFSKGLLMLNHL